MKKNLAKAITLGLLLTSVHSLSAYAADTYGTVDVDGYGQEEIQATAKSGSGVLFDGGWYAPDGKFYTYVDESGNLGDTLIACEVVDGRAVLTTAQENTLTKLGLDHNQQADAIGDNTRVPSYMQMIGGNKFTAQNVSQALADNLKFNSDLIRTVSEWEEADRKATDQFLNNRIDQIDMHQDGNELTFIDGDGNASKFVLTDTNTTNQTLTNRRSADDITIALVDSNKHTVSTTLTDIGKASDIRQNTAEITNIKNNYIAGVTQEGDTITVIQGDGTTSTLTDHHVNGFEQSEVGAYGTSDAGKITSTIKTNFGETYSDTVDISDYVSDAIRAEASGGTLIINDTTTTIGDQITVNTNHITELTQDVTTIKNDYVQNVSQEGDTLTITQIVDGEEQSFDFTDRHIDNIAMTGPTYYGTEDAGKITTTITDNLEQTYSASVDISDYVEGAIYTNAADAKLIINGDKTTIGDQITVNTNELNKGWNAQVDGKNVNTVKMGDAQNFVSGDNVILAGDDSGNIIVSTKQEVSFNRVTVGNTTINDNSITVGNTIRITDSGADMGDTKITNVRAGDIYQGSQDAVNAGQLWNTNRQLDALGGRLNKVGAGAAALAALHPMDFDPDDKLNFAAGVGNYGGSTASALGIFYRPNEKVMLNLAGTLGNGENMVNAGISFALGKGGKVNDSKVAMAHEIADLRSQVAELTAMVNSLIGNGSYDFSGSPLLFPDIPANHWAYEYIEQLSAAGIVEGYPDGTFDGDRTMTRYEFAAMLYRALSKGTVIDARLMHEFESELGRIRIDHIRGENLSKVERVRVITADDRDHYGGK